MRLKATIAYNGTKFYGFQRQKTTSNTVVGHLEKALSSLGIKSKVYGSGRTDRGVHATGQVIHFDIPHFWQKKSLQQLKEHLNSKLKAITVKYIKAVDANFHAQYNAKTRIYRYVIKCTTPSIFEEEFVSYYKIKDPLKIYQALQLYRGKHDFSYFKKEGSITSTNIRTIKNIKVREIKNYYIIYLYADGYLRSQVRMMIEGALKVENEELTLSELQEQIDTKRKHFTTLAKPQGLYLHRVVY